MLDCFQADSSILGFGHSPWLAMCLSAFIHKIRVLFFRIERSYMGAVQQVLQQ